MREGPPSGGRALANRAARGAGFTIAGGLFARALGVVGTLAITYFLSPETVGEIADASVLVLSANQLSSFGFGQYVVAARDLRRDAVWHASVFHLATGALALAACFALAGLFARTLHAPSLPLYLPGLALAVALDRVSFIPERLLVRELRFGIVSAARTTSEVLYSAIAVGLAAVGTGAMSLVVATLARSLLRAIVLSGAADRRAWLSPSPLSRKTTRELLAFSLPLWVTGTCSFVARRWDNLLVSGLFGAAVLGDYNLAYNLADIPATQVGEQIGDVLLPTFAHLDADAQKRALVRSTALLSLIVFPLAVGLGVVAPTLVGTLLPLRWQGVGPMLLVLSALSVARPIGWTIASYLVARSRTTTLMVLGVSKVALLLGSIALFARWGPIAACAGVGVAFGINAVGHVVALVLLERFRARDFVRASAGPLAACGVLAAAVVGARHVLRSAGIETGGVALAVEIVAGGAAYLGAAAITSSGTLRDLVGIASRAVRPGVRSSHPATD